MKIKTSVVNPQISLENIELEFDKYGVYIISGDNGSGKSSIIKKIIFEEKDIIFNVENEEKLSDEKKDRFIAYVEQDPLAYDCSLYKFITRFQKNVEENKIKKYLDDFDIGYIKLNQNIMTLSGGELVKANIIASLIKDTPYVFMDEPTNNLDNDGVRRFVKIINEYSKTHTVIIISHDPRVNFINAIEYGIQDSKVILMNSNDEKTSNTNKISPFYYPRKELIKDYLLSLPVVIYMIVISLIIVLMCFANYILYINLIPDDQTIVKKDIIIGYKVDEKYDELNQIYTESENISVDKEKYYQMIYFSHLQELINDFRVEDILLPDVEYINQLSENNYAIAQGEVVELEQMLFSIPSEILYNFYGQIALPCDVMMLKQGRLPKDNDNEITISEDMANQYWGSSEDIIGKKILIRGEEYTVVGISYNNIAMISFCGDQYYGYFSLKNNLNKIESLKQYLLDNEYYLTDGTSEEIFLLKKGCEKNMLDYLVKNYPAENYASYQFERVFNKSLNAKGIRTIILIDVVMAFIISVLILAINRKYLKTSIIKATSIDNYYCKKDLTIRMYTNINYAVLVLFSIIAIIFALILYSQIVRYCIICLLLCVIIQSIQLRWKIK